MTLKPADLALPFNSFRPGQLEIIERIVASPKKVVFYQGPTGSGKSAIACGVMAYLQARGGIITADLALQDQYKTTFDSMLSMSGRDHHKCVILPGEVRASSGPCVAGYRCSETVTPMHPFGACPYYQQRHQALASPLFVTSYAMWVSLGRSGALRDYPMPDILVADEGHRAEMVLLDQITIDLNPVLLRRMGVVLQKENRESVEALQRWASVARSSLNAKAADSQDFRVMAQYRRQADDVERLAKIEDTGQYVVSEGQRGMLHVRPVFAPWAFRQYIMNNVEKVVVMSATLLSGEYLAFTLGLQPDEWEWIESTMTFPRGRRPIHIVPGGRVSARDMSSYAEVIETADQFIEQNMDGKGLIHTGNYKLAEALERHSKFSRQIIFYETQNRRQAIEEFKQSAAPRYLAGPSLTEGLDLPYDLVTRQLLLKLPIPNLGDPWVERRRKLDKDWLGYQTAVQIVQAYGRGIRAKDDWCDFYILDGNWTWWSRQNRKFLPRWFTEAIQE